MHQESWLILVAANIAGLPFRLFGRRPFSTPGKALLLKPGSISQVMLATPLLAVLSDAFPQATFDWAVNQQSRPALEGNPHLNQVIDAGQAMMPGGSSEETRAFVHRLKGEGYDTCIIPSTSSWLSYYAWRAAIPQRIGLNVQGRGFAQTLPVKPSTTAENEAQVNLEIAEALGIDLQAEMGFYPSDDDRSAIKEDLLGEIGWDGIEPLAVLHPGGGESPVDQNQDVRWPADRFAILGSRLKRNYGAKVILVGGDGDKDVVEEVQGLMSIKAANLCAKLSLGELGALCKLADLYVGNDTGPTHIAVAMGCPTLALFGPTNPELHRPFTNNGKLRVLKAESHNRPFSWDEGASVEQALSEIDKLLGLPPNHLSSST